MARYYGTCACHGQWAVLVFAKGDPNRQLCYKCWRNHRDKYRTDPHVRPETQEEYFARLATKIEAAPPSPPVELPPPRDSVPLVIKIGGKRVTAGVMRSAKTPEELEELRRQHRRLMDYNVKNYRERRYPQSRTSLK